MRLLVTGGRDFSNYFLVGQTLLELNASEICHGGARGADALAGEWARVRKVPCQVFMADWKSLGKSAGIRRNERMLREFKPDMVVAFGGGKGTSHMVRIAYEGDYQIVLKGWSESQLQGISFMGTGPILRANDR